jgi:hypothetical protein
MPTDDSQGLTTVEVEAIVGRGLRPTLTVISQADSLATMNTPHAANRAVDAHLPLPRNLE